MQWEGPTPVGGWLEERRKGWRKLGEDEFDLSIPGHSIKIDLRSQQGGDQYGSVNLTGRGAGTSGKKVYDLTIDGRVETSGSLQSCKTSGEKIANDFLPKTTTKPCTIEQRGDKWFFNVENTGWQEAPALIKQRAALVRFLEGSFGCKVVNR